MNKIIPGPWIAELHEGKFLIFAVVDNKVNFIATSKVRDNANFIAAAPEMYEALKKALEAVESEGFACAEIIKKALAKAEGEK